MRRRRVVLVAAVSDARVEGKLAAQPEKVGWLVLRPRSNCQWDPDPERVSCVISAPPDQSSPSAASTADGAMGLWVAGRPAGQEAETVAVIRNLYERFNERDEDGLLALYSPCAKVQSLIAAVDGSRFLGRDGVRQWYRTLVGTLAMTIEAGQLLGYRRYVLSIPTLHVSVGENRQSYEVGIVYEVDGGQIERSFGYGKAGAAIVKLGGLLLGHHELKV